MHHLEYSICKVQIERRFSSIFLGSICGTPQNCQAFWDFSASAYPPEELKELFGGTARLVGRVLAAPGVEWEIDEHDDLWCIEKLLQLLYYVEVFSEN